MKPEIQDMKREMEKNLKGLVRDTTVFLTAHLMFYSMRYSWTTSHELDSNDCDIGTKYDQSEQGIFVLDTIR